MPDPVTLTAATARYELPFLFFAQAQKEAFINEALVRIDTLLHPAVLAEQVTPPADPQPGTTYLVAESANGEWEGKAGALAAWTGSQWVFVAARSGMTARDLSTGQVLVFDGDWIRVSDPVAPEGGSTIDTECREALAALIEALRSHGIFSS